MFRCPVEKCYFSTQYKLQLQLHEVVHQNTDFRYYTCRLCDYTSPKKHNVQRHMAVRHYAGEKVQLHPFMNPQAHPPEEEHREQRIIFEEQFQCSFCHYRSTRKLNVINHQILRHNSGDDATNPEDQEVSVPKPRSDHSELEIMVVNSFQCSRCDYTSSKRQNVRRHINRKHNNVGVVLSESSNELLKPYSGVLNSYCRRKEPSPETKDKIIFEERFQCSACDYRSTDRVDVLRHQSLRHNINDEVPDDFHCNMCDYFSNKKHNLSRHKSRKHRRIANAKEEESGSKKEDSAVREEDARMKGEDSGITKEDSREFEDEPAKRLLLAECGLIWNSETSSKKDECSSSDRDTPLSS